MISHLPPAPWIDVVAGGAMGLVPSITTLCPLHLPFSSG